MKDIPIPFNLSKNDRDRRGFPIPFIVYRDTGGVPHFTVDDTRKIDLVLAEKRCGLCGKPLKLGQMWMIGGASALHNADEIFTVPPAHKECARYAIQVCPYLAAPVYSRLIEARTLNAGTLHEAVDVHHDQIVPDRAPFFVLARTSGVKWTDSGDGSGKQYISPRRPWKEVEFWRNGTAISRSEADAILAGS